MYVRILSAPESVVRGGRVEYPPELKLMLKRALEDPEGFWGEAAKDLHWFKRWDRVFETPLSFGLLIEDSTGEVLNT